MKNEFKPNFELDLKHDLKVLYYIKEKWNSIENYPKRERIVDLLNNDLKNKKVVIFTEFIDTANDLYKLISEKCYGNVKLFSGKSSNEDREDVLFNFDDNLPKENQKNDYRILVTTDTLSQGVNLHRSNVIINFDIPWNPTKMMQRVGRVQRLDTKFDEIYIYNFFPTAPIEKNIQVQFLAEKKIAMFIELLGNDSQLLTDEPIQSYDLFNKLNSNIMDEEEIVDDELKYLKLLRDIRDNDFELFKKIEELPKKARVARKSYETPSLITLMKYGKFKKVFKSNSDGTTEIDFFDAVKDLKSKPDEKGFSVDDDYYMYLHNNLNAFEELLNLPEDERRLTKNESLIIKYIKLILQDKDKLSSYDINFLIKLKDLINDGHITKNQAKKIISEIKNSPNNIHLILNILRKNIREEDLKTDTKEHLDESNEEFKQIILSEYFI